jgi:tryptophanyl-tRNA synthetase
MLTCVAGKGILNRAHAYKAAVDKNLAEGEDQDFGITAGLFMYPVLMAADILIFNAHKVPVGRDQIQHIEMARDFGQRFNHLYGDRLTLPEAVIEEHVATLPGLDGRKMSKSYDNTIPLFCSREQLKKLIFSIVTDSRAPGEAKDIEGSALFQLYQAFASAEETAAMRAAYAQGIGWGDAKQQVFARIDAELSPMRERYAALMAEPQKIEAMLREGAQVARTRYAIPLLRQLREAVGFRDLSRMADASATDASASAQAKHERAPQLKQYREQDGKFYFKLTEADEVLIESHGFDHPKDAGAWIARFKREGKTALGAASDAVFARLDPRAGSALDALKAAEEAKAQAKA